MVPCPWAGTSATCDRATSTVSAMRWLVSTLPATTAEGQRAFTRQPSGATTLMGANVPALLTGTSLARSTCMAKLQAERVTEMGQLTLPATAGDVPVKSMIAESPSITTRTQMGMSASVMPSPSIWLLARYSPSGRRSSASRVRRSV